MTTQIMTMQETTIEQLAVQLQSAKQEERLAADRRIALEQAITEKLGAKTEGSQTHTLENGMKVTITGKLTRSLDQAAWEEVKSEIPESLWPIKVKQELDTTGVKYLMANEPQIYALVSKAITTKPAKTAVEVK